MDVLLEIEKDGEEVCVIEVPVASEEQRLRDVLSPTALAAEIELEDLLLI